MWFFSVWMKRSWALALNPSVILPCLNEEVLSVVAYRHAAAINRISQCLDRPFIVQSGTNQTSQDTLTLSSTSSGPVFRMVTCRVSLPERWLLSEMKCVNLGVWCEAAGIMSHNLSRETSHAERGYNIKHTVLDMQASSTNHHTACGSRP